MTFVLWCRQPSIVLQRGKETERVLEGIASGNEGAGRVNKK